MDGMSKADIRARIVSSIEEMAPLSPAATRIMTLLNDIDASPWELLQIIKTDPILTSRVLRLINSAYFGLETSISSLNRALVILGLNTVKNLTLSGVVLDAVASQRRDTTFADEMWSHSLWVGVAARAIARARRAPRDDQELAFIGGLLHDLGELCILNAFPAEFKEMSEKTGWIKFQESTERRVFGGTHTEYGAMLGRRWSFPEELVVCLETHHTPLLEGEHAVISCTIHLANHISFLHHRPGSVTDPTADRPEVLEVLGLRRSAVLEATRAVGNEVQAARAFLEA